MTLLILVADDNYKGPAGLKAGDLVMVRTAVDEHDYLKGVISKALPRKRFEVKITGRFVKKLKKALAGRVLTFHNKNLRILKRST